MKGKWYIYKITNLINSKNYIGKRRHQECDTPLQERYMGSGRLIKQAIKKYGYQNFKKEILDDLIETNQEAALKEVVWITYYKETGGANYNLCYGINSKRGDFLTEKESFREFAKDPSNQEKYKKVIEDLKQIIENDKGLASFYDEWEESKKKSWGEKISQSLKEYNANLTSEQKAEISKHLSEAQLKYLNEKETPEHRERRLKKSAEGTTRSHGKEFEIINPEGNKIKIKGLSTWCRNTFGEELRGTAVSTLRDGRSFKGYTLIITDELNSGVANKTKTYTIQTPNGDILEVVNLTKFCREVLNNTSGTLKLRGKYRGFILLGERDSTLEEKRQSQKENYAEKYKDYVLPEPKEKEYKPNKTYVIRTPEGKDIEVTNLQSWCLDTFGVKGSYIGILTNGRYKGYRIIERYNTSRGKECDLNTK